jgi:surface protein
LAKAKYEARLKSTVDGMTVELSIPKKLKKMGRIIEKTLLKRKDDPGNANKVCDLVHGMVTCENMGQIATIVQRLGSSSDIVVTRIKDRFLTSPSGGGWRDCMLNFYLKEDSNQHVCEVQLVHAQMMTARKGLPGHAVYNRVRNADEIVNQWMDKEKPETKEELQEWIVGWQMGDKGTRGPPNLWDIRKVTDMSELFNLEELKEFNDPIGDWDVRNVVNMELMFNGAESFNQPIGQWQTENVTTMKEMFYEAASFNQPIGQWKTENVTTMQAMFREAASFNQPIGQWQTENVTNMNMMFRSATSFNQPIGEWQTKNVTNMKVMFMYAESFNQPIGQWQTENVTTMEMMFVDAILFNRPIGQWQTGNVTNMEGMFGGATSFNQPIGQWKSENTNTDDMFEDAKAMEEKNKPKMK